EGQRVLTLLAPGIELVRLEALLPGVLGLVLGAGEPVGAPQLVVRLDQVRPELEGFLEEGLGVLVHLALQVDEAEIEVGVERRLLVVVEPDRLREVRSEERRVGKECRGGWERDRERKKKRRRIC